jgi:predicted transcriptional regulator
VAGHRRLQAAKNLDFDTIPVVFIDLADDKDRVSVQWHENVVRENLSAWEQAQITMALKDMGMTQPEVATELGLTKHQVSEQQKIAKALAEQDPELLRLLTLPGLEDLVEQGERTDVAETSELISRVLEAVTQEGKDMSRAAWEAANDIDNEIGNIYLEGVVRDAEAVGATFVDEAPTRAERLVWHDIDGELKTYNEFGWEVDDIDTHRDTEECHVYFIQEGYQRQKNLTEWCSKPNRHKANGKSELKEKDAKTKQKMTDKDKAERKATKQAKLDRGVRAAAALMARRSTSSCPRWCTSQRMLPGWYPKRSDSNRSCRRASATTWSRTGMRRSRLGWPRCPRRSRSLPVSWWWLPRRTSMIVRGVTTRLL